MKCGEETKLLLLRSTSVRFEPVIQRRVDAAAASGSTVVVYWDRKGGDRPGVEGNARFVPIAVTAKYGVGIKGVAQRLKFSCLALRRVLREKPDVVHACDLDTMIIAVAYRVLSFRRPYIIYDILDFIYQFSSPIPLALRNALRWLDSKLMAIADVIVVPDENRLRHVPRLLHQRCRIVHNAPALDGMGPSDSGERVGAAIKVVYVGGLSRDRGIRFLLSACEKFADRLQLSIAGQGVLVEEVREYSGRCSNIEFLGQVPFGTALAMMRDSDLLYAVYDPDCDVNKVASPNKFFEAVSLGKPIMVAAGTSVDEKVDRLRMGYVVEYSEASVHATFASIRREELRQMGENARSGQSVYGYAAAQRVLRQVYEEATRRRQAACSK